MRGAEAHVLDRFPEVQEVTVRVAELHVAVSRAVSGVSVEVRFRR